MTKKEDKKRKIMMRREGGSYLGVTSGGVLDFFEKTFSIVLNFLPCELLGKIYKSGQLLTQTYEGLLSLHVHLVDQGSNAFVSEIPNKDSGLKH